MVALVTVGEAAQQLGVDPTTLRRWEKRGRVRPLRDYRGWRFYRPEDIERLRRWREPRPPRSVRERKTGGAEGGESVGAETCAL